MLQGAGLLRTWKDRRFAVGIGYDSSPVDDDRTIDLPIDKQLKSSMSHSRKGTTLDYALGATLIYLGDGKVDRPV